MTRENRLPLVTTPPLLLLVLLLAILGCTENPESPPTRTDDPVAASGAVDPAGGTFVLGRVDVPGPDGTSARLELVGSRLEVDRENETVDLDVAVRNAGDRIVAEVQLGAFGFQPHAVTITNPDFMEVPNFGLPLTYWFEYGDRLGDDRVLSPDETSASRTWTFAVPGLGAFAFEIRTAVDNGPSAAHISGRVFADRNRNGIWDADEERFPAGHIVLTPPDGLPRRTPNVSGRFEFQVDAIGLYRLQLVLPPDICAVAPGAIEVVLTPGRDGEPQSYDDVLFAVVPCRESEDAVRLTDGDSLAVEQDPYELIDVRLEGLTLFLSVGFSGCSPDHPLTLWASTSFMESEPIRTWILLAHDDRDEPCDAYFQRDLQFRLEPLQRAIIRAYGEPVPAILLFRDPSGRVVRELRFNH